MQGPLFCEVTFCKVTCHYATKEGKTRGFNEDIFELDYLSNGSRQCTLL